MPYQVIANDSVSIRMGLPAIFKGMMTTIGHLLKNIRNLKGLPTILYPEEKRNYSSRFRGRHVLKVRDDGTMKCVACFMCQTACPADCIDIVAGEHPNLAYEKYPVQFDIDMLRCVFCGYCVDACPKDAIIMTRDYELAMFHREEAVYGIEDLRQRLPLKQLDLGYRPYYGDDPTRADSKNYPDQRSPEVRARG